MVLSAMSDGAATLLVCGSSVAAGASDAGSGVGSGAGGSGVGAGGGTDHDWQRIGSNTVFE